MAGPTLVVTHKQCALHVTRPGDAERPERVAIVMRSLKELHRSLGARGRSTECAESRREPFEFLELTSSEAMLRSLKKSLLEMSGHTTPPSPCGGGGGDRAGARAPPALMHTKSVAFFDEYILPGVRAVHTHAYLSRLAETCYHLTVIEAERHKRAQPVALDMDTPASASSLSAALCAVLSCCKAVDAVCSGEHYNAFAAIRPPGHHAGAAGLTAGGASFDERSHALSGNARPAKRGSIAPAAKEAEAAAIRAAAAGGVASMDSVDGGASGAVDGGASDGAPGGASGSTPGASSRGVSGRRARRRKCSRRRLKQMVKIQGRSGRPCWKSWRARWRCRKVCCTISRASSSERTWRRTARWR